MMDPRHYVASETLKDGTLVTVRAIRLDDADAILKAFNDLDRESVYRRFFSPKKELTDDELAQLTDVDFSRVVALLVTKRTGESEVLMGAAASQRTIPVRRRQSSRSSLVVTIAVSALRLSSCGISCGSLKSPASHGFEADVLAENQPMLAVFRRSGLPMQLGRDGNVLHVTLALQPDSIVSVTKASSMSAYGTKRTSLPTLRMSAFRGEADIPDPRSSVR